MARHLRVQFPGAIYHVTVRMLGDWKRERNLLFEDNADRQRYRLRLSERVGQYNIRLMCGCVPCARILNVQVGAFRQRRRDSALRGAAARCLCRYAGLTQREVAGILQVGSGTAISHQLRNLSAILNKDHNLARLLQRAEKQFEADRRTATEQSKSAGA